MHGPDYMSMKKYLRSSRQLDKDVGSNQAGNQTQSTTRRNGRYNKLFKMTTPRMLDGEI